MSATYYLILTAYGAARIAQLQADQSSAPLLVNFVAGDANGNPYLPQSRINATALINQRISVPLQSVDVVDDDTCQAVAVLDATVGSVISLTTSATTVDLLWDGGSHSMNLPIGFLQAHQTCLRCRSHRAIVRLCRCRLKFQ